MAVSKFEARIAILLEKGQYEKAIEEIRKKTGQAGKEMQTIGKTGSAAFAGMQASAVAVGHIISNMVMQAFRKLNQILREGVDEYIKQRKALLGLEQGLKNTGQYSAEVVEQFKNLASELQKATGVADDEILQAARVLTTFGLTAKEIQDTIPVMLDVNAVVGDVNASLTSMANQFGKVIAQPEEMASAMSRSGVIIEKETLKGLSLEQQRQEVLRQITAQYGGQARAMQEASGGLDRLKAAWGDFKEIFGRWVTENLEPAIRKLTEVLERADLVFRTQETIDDMMKKNYLELSPERLSSLYETTGAKIKELGSQIELLNDHIRSGKSMNVKLDTLGRNELVKEFQELKKTYAILDEVIKIKKESADVGKKSVKLTKEETGNAQKLLDIWELIKIKVEGKAITQRSAVQNLHDEALAEEAIVSIYTKRQSLSQEELDKLKTALDRLEYYKKLVKEISESKTAGGMLGIQEKDTKNILTYLEAIAQIASGLPDIFSKVGELTGMSAENIDTVNLFLNDTAAILMAIVNQNPIGIILTALVAILDVIKKIKDNANDAKKAVDQMSRVMSASQKAISELIAGQEKEWAHLEKIGQTVSDAEKLNTYQQLLIGNKLVNGSLEERWYLEEQIYALQQQIAGTPLTEQEKLERQLKILESEYALLEEQGLDVTANVSAQIDVLNQLLNLEDDIIEQNEIKLQILKKQQEISEATADAIKEQLDYSKELSELQRFGLLDIENFSQLRKLTATMKASGASSYEIAQTLSGAGATEKNYTVNIGQINQEFNEASGDTLDDANTALISSLLGGR